MFLFLKTFCERRRLIMEVTVYTYMCQLVHIDIK